MRRSLASIRLVLTIVGAIATLGAAACGTDPEGSSKGTPTDAGAAGETAKGGKTSGGTAGRDAGGSGGQAGEPIDTGGTKSAGGTGGSGDGNGGVGGDAGDGGDAGGGGDAGDGGESATGGSGNRGGTGPLAGAGGLAGMGGGGFGGASAGAGGTSGGASGASGGDLGCGSGSTGGPSDDGPSCSARCLEELGENPCGTWACTPSGECTILGCEDSDDDGFGIGASCTCPLDCDDHDDDVTVSKTAPCCRTGAGERTCTNGVWGTCSAGTPATAEACDGEDDDCDGVPDNDLGTFTCGLGACAVTVPACVNGAVNACVPSAPTTTTDSCNGVDDDCDGAVDEDCIDCVRVAPDGSDDPDLPNRSLAAFRNVQTAIAYAYAHPELPPRVCVAAGQSCGTTATYLGPCGEDLTMRNGIDMMGGYESSNWTRCPSSTVRLAPLTGKGVYFGGDIVEPTHLDGFAIDRFAADVTAGVTVSGGRNVMLSDLEILDGPEAKASYGVNVTNGAEVTIARSRIDGGRAIVGLSESEAFGVRAFESRVFLEDNCEAGFDASGRCTQAAAQYPIFFPAPDPCEQASIRGQRYAADQFGRYAAVELVSSPASRIERSSVCLRGVGGWEVDRMTDAAVIIRGNAAGTSVRASAIDNVTRKDQRPGHGLLARDCDGASPRIVDNARIGGSGLGVALGAYGDCHPVIESNLLIEARVRDRGDGTGIACGAAHGVSSLCTIVNNSNISVAFEATPSTQPYPTVHSTGLTCTACPKISRNRITGLSGGGDGFIFAGPTGVVAGGDGLVERNWITSGCANSTNTGMVASGNLTIVNNVIQGQQRACGSIAGDFLRPTALVAGGGFLNVHSNYIRAGTDQPMIKPIGGSGFSYDDRVGVRFTGAMNGIFRNNRILLGHWSPNSRTFVEDGVDADPDIFENNSLDGDNSSPAMTYVDEGTTVLRPSEANALTDMVASGNIPGCYSPLQLNSTSTCRNAGTTAGAPSIDIDGDPRDSQPDIGPDEYVP
jgi:hypothetical protein